MNAARITCPYCQRPAELIRGSDVYGHRQDLHHKWFWVCRPCDARVGCHDGTRRPLGRLADAELRAAKMRAHAAFDPLWRDGRMTRSEAYAWLAEQLGLDPGECHVGMFDVEQCLAVERACREFLAT